MRRIWDDKLVVKSKAVAVMQARTVVKTACWAGAVSAVLTLGSLWVPAGNLF